MGTIVDLSNPAKTLKCWVELYSDKLYTWAYYKTSNRETAEDLVQDTFLAAVTSFSKFEGKSNPQTWLTAILNNKIIDYHRKRIKDPTINEASQNLPEGAAFFDNWFDKNGSWLKDQQPGSWPNTAEHLLDDNNFSNILQLCMRKLPGNWLSALQLKYLEGKKAELICQELGIATTNYWQILHRAKLQLRKCLEMNWFKK
ncbi:MAG: sigma-70 family RNA polymerase sigma factor [Bacteroidota bacterium]